MRYAVSMLLLAGLFCCAPAMGQEQIVEIGTLAQAATAPALTIPWVEADSQQWHSGDALIVIDGTDPGARAWAAVSTRGLLLRIVVADAMHRNTQADGAIWDGDAIQLGIDMLGQGVGPMPRDAAFTGPHVASITFALTAQGAKAWAHHHGRPGGEGAMPQLAPQIARDDSAKTTTYDLLLPWAEFQAQPGLSPVLGLAIQVNDTDDGPQQQRILFGDGAGGAVRPGLFELARLGEPPGEVVSVGVTRKDLYLPGDRAQMTVAVSSQRDLDIRTSVGEGETTSRLARSERGEGIVRYAVRTRADLEPREALPMRVSVADANTGEVLAEHAVQINWPGRVIDAVHTKLQAKAAAATQPLLAQHFRAADALVQTDWHRGLTMADQMPHLAAQTVQYAQQILDNIDAPDVSDFETYRQGRRGLLRSFISPADGTLQYYSLSLPRGWDPAQRYPLIVHLHGAGNPHPLNNVAGSFAPRREPATQAATQAQPLPPLYTIYPWARGNVGYSGIGEIDVWDAVSDMTRTFATDPDRTYLQGFSMGGGGTWALGITRPDRWAAICIMAGGPWWVPTDLGMGQNLVHTPVMIWHGEQDGAVPVTDAYAMQKDLQASGVEPVMTIVPNMGHQQTDEAMDLVNRWLLQHTRKRPASFAFKASDEAHRACRGIRMRYDPKLSAMPSFTCRIEGQVVHLDSQGTSGLDVDLGPEGLGLSGQVTIVWNGKEAYRGPAMRPSLGEGGGW